MTVRQARGGLLRAGVALSAVAFAVAGCSSGSSRAAQAPAGATSAASPTVTATAAATPVVATAPVVAPSAIAATPPSAAPISTAAPAPTTAPPAAASSTPTATPTTSATPSPTPSPIADPAAAAYQKWQPIEDEAYFRLEGNYPPLVAISTPNRITFEVSDLAAHKKAGDHQVGLTQGVVIGVGTTSPTQKTLRVCQNLTSGYWADKAGKRLSEPKAKWQADMVAMILVDGVWKVDSLYAGTFSCKALP